MELGAGGHWNNWVGNQSFISQHAAVPESEEELCALVAEAGRRGLKVRVAGSGHSFTPVVATPGLRLSLEKLSGIRKVDMARKRVSLAAGTRIGDAGRALKGLGLSLTNQGDIDTQAFAGALSTGTHGTGIKLGNLASQVVGMRLVQPSGEILEITDADPDLLNAARVSIGLLGIVSEVTLQVMDAYNLRERLWRDDFETCLAHHDALAAEHRHFGFFWCPTPESRHLYCLPDTAPVSTTSKLSDVCEMKVMDITDEPPEAAEGEFERIAYSSEIYPIEYVPNFHELEYAVPLEKGKDALCEVRALMQAKHLDCIYPLEYRFTASDKGWISPFYEQDSVTVSVSGGPGIAYWPYLREVDAILRQYASRPHWGKLHFMNREDVDALYPKANAFRDLRRKLDPDGMFLNDHLGLLFS
ncbi:D-arabinono-1,4-lactone oxidase [Roseixanthobacter pseudopolyaromaticivorans]|uniref:D-arabinono-1,4-lactone oxidase n=1 Tax=Xanthobacteraceae TaxID=335928 RepID=UPI00372877F0